MTPEVRLEARCDKTPVGDLLRVAFDSNDEVLLVERLRAEEVVAVSLVAVAAGQVIGQVLFSRLRLDGPQPEISAAALAPLAVRPDWQRQGLGARLVRAGLAHCQQREIQLILVLGDPVYYGRFGFSSEAARTLDAPFAGPAFMALELTPGVLSGRRAKVHYAAAFGFD